MFMFCLKKFKWQVWLKYAFYCSPSNDLSYILKYKKIIMLLYELLCVKIQAQVGTITNYVIKNLLKNLTFLVFADEINLFITIIETDWTRVMYFLLKGKTDF